MIDERLRWLEAERLGHCHHAVLRDRPGAPELPTVGELPAEWVAPVVEDVRLRYPAWKLAGADDQPIHDRLDAHFARLHETKRLEVAARQAADADEAHRRVDVERQADEAATERDRALWGIE